MEHMSAIEKRIFAGRSESAQSLAHDFNNLLAGIMNYASLLAGEVDELIDRHGLADDDVARLVSSDVAEITGLVARAAGLTERLLTFSRATPAPGNQPAGSGT
jgi:signal transduction histidine kinase